MRVKSIEYVELITQMREYIIQDWNAQREAGQRDYDISWPRFDKDLKKRYPDVFSSSTFKTVYIYDNINKEGSEKREFSLKRLQYILRYFYRDLMVDMGWPSTTQFLRDYKGGEYYPLIESATAGQTPTEIGQAVSDMLSGQFTTDSDRPVYIQIAQLAVRAKEEYEELEGKNVELQDAINQRDELIKKVVGERQAIREDLAYLEGVLKTKGGDQSEIIERIDNLKQKLLK